MQLLNCRHTVPLTRAHRAKTKASPARPLGFEELKLAIADHAAGVDAKTLYRRFRDRITRRTLLRRLGELVDRGEVVTRGRARALRYLLPDAAGGGILTPSPRVSGDGDVGIPVSPESRSIRQDVQKPFTERTPVAYRREFLEAYVPNQTFYLPGSMREHLAHIGRPPGGGQTAGTYARQIYDRLLIDLSWASSRLEGNTYSWLDTQRLIDLGERALGKDAQETQMILNHKAAIEFLVEQVEDIAFNRYTICNLHALLADNLLENPEGAGRLRRIPVQIGETTYYPLSIPQVVDECFQRVLDGCAAIADPFEQAFFALVHIPYLQPFIDVNKRVSRLAANIPLLKRNLCPLSFIDVPGRDYIDGMLAVYELNRIELLRDVFAWAYERSCQRYVARRQSLAEPDPFRMRYRDALTEVIGQLVKRGTAEPESFVREYATTWIPNHERDQFVSTALADIRRLHEGSIARYRIRPSEFYAWKQVSNRDGRPG